VTKEQMMSEQGAGRWLVWGDGTAADVRASALGGLGAALASAISSLDPVRPDDSPATDPDAGAGPAAVIREQDSGWTAPDCGEGELFDDPDEDTRLIALIHEQDPDWTAPGCGDPEDPSGKISWMEVVRNATESEIQARVAAHSAATRGFVRLT
jgi:hypothetical protein